MSKTLQKKLFIAYLILLPFAFLYVNKALKTNSIKVANFEEPKPVPEFKPAKVQLVVKGNKYAGNYSYEMTTRETVQDLLEKLRLDNKIYFEIVDYTNSKKILVDDKADDSVVWIVKHNDVDITSKIDEVQLEENGVYYLEAVAK